MCALIINGKSSAGNIKQALGLSFFLARRERDGGGI